MQNNEVQILGLYNQYTSISTSDAWPTCALEEPGSVFMGGAFVTRFKSDGTCEFARSVTGLKQKFDAQISASADGSSTLKVIVGADSIQPPKGMPTTVTIWKGYQSPYRTVPTKLDDVLSISFGATGDLSSVVINP